MRRAYVLVTAAYWTFTVTDGALRMLVLLYFHELGYDAVSLALLFVLYEFFGVVTNLVAGWAGARHGLHRTLQIGLGLQVVALVLLSAHSPSWRQWLAVMWVMGAQAMSGIAKDLVKTSAKTAMKFVAADSGLFRLVARLTGSKNALKGVGFFVGGALLQWRGFDQALWIMAGLVGAVLVVIMVMLDDVGRSSVKPRFGAILTKSSEINRLSVARFFLFGSRDIWFVVALPVFLDETLGWSFGAIGAFLAVWVIGYGVVQAGAPGFLGDYRATPYTATLLMMMLAGCAAGVAVAVSFGELKALLTVAGILAFGVLFALVSAVHSYLILAYSRDRDQTALDVGFYYSANAAGRLVGTILSGVLYTIAALPGALWGTVAFLLAAIAVSATLPEPDEAAPLAQTPVAV